MAGCSGVEIVDVGLVVLVVVQGHYLVRDVGFERLPTEETTLEFTVAMMIGAGDKHVTINRVYTLQLSYVLFHRPTRLKKEKQTHVICIRQRWERVLLSTRHINRSSDLRRFRA